MFIFHLFRKVQLRVRLWPDILVRSWSGPEKSGPVPGSGPRFWVGSGSSWVRVQSGPGPER